MRIPLTGCSKELFLRERIWRVQRKSCVSLHSPLPVQELQRAGHSRVQAAVDAAARASCEHLAEHELGRGAGEEGDVSHKQCHHRLCLPFHSPPDFIDLNTT